MGQTWSQAYPPQPAFTEKNLADLSNKTYLITGANSGLGLQLAALLYSRNATLFLLARSEPKLNEALSEIKSRHPSSTGRLQPIVADLADLPSVRQAAQAILSQADRLDVIFHNAGILCPPRDAESKQGLELHMAVHALSPHLLTRLLESLLLKTAKSSDPNAVRLVWVGSVGTTIAPPGGVGKFVDLQETPEGVKTYLKDTKPLDKYGISKAGAYYLAANWYHRLQDRGIVSVSLDPGNLQTGLQRTFDTEFGAFLTWLLGLNLHNPVKGAYTELFAGLAPEVDVDSVARFDGWVRPFGQLSIPMRDIRVDLAAAMKTPEDGGSPEAAKYWDWCGAEVRPYLIPEANVTAS